MVRPWWSVLTECDPLEKGIANHFSILPWEPHEQIEGKLAKNGSSMRSVMHHQGKENREKRFDMSETFTFCRSFTFLKVIYSQIPKHGVNAYQSWLHCKQLKKKKVSFSVASFSQFGFHWMFWFMSASFLTHGIDLVYGYQAFSSDTHNTLDTST